MHSQENWESWAIVTLTMFAFKTELCKKRYIYICFTQRKPKVGEVVLKITRNILLGGKCKHTSAIKTQRKCK